MIELNEKDLCLEIREQLSWDNSVKNIFAEIAEEVFDWCQDNIDNCKNGGEATEDMENCKNFLDTVSYKENDWTRELKIETLKNIKDYWETVSYRSDCEVSIFDEDIIREGIFQTIEENFGFDARELY
jgi:hypothetical protein